MSESSSLGLFAEDDLPVVPKPKVETPAVPGGTAQASEEPIQVTQKNLSMLKLAMEVSVFQKLTHQYYEGRIPTRETRWCDPEVGKAMRKVRKKLERAHTPEKAVAVVEGFLAPRRQAGIHLSYQHRGRPRLHEK